MLGYCGSEEVVHRDNISMMTIRNPLPGDGSNVADVASLRSSNNSERADSDILEPLRDAER